MIIACIISFVVGAMLMMFALGIVSVCKDREPRNKVHFFVKRVISDNYLLYIGGKDRQYPIASTSLFENLGLNPDDFVDMREGQLREVFINLEE